MKEWSLAILWHVFSNQTVSNTQKSEHLFISSSNPQKKAKSITGSIKTTTPTADDERRGVT